MKSIYLACLVVFATSLISCSVHSSDANTQSPDEVKRELTQLERRLIVAVQRKDMDTLDQIWAKEYFGTAIGRTVNKGDLMSAVQGGAIQMDSLDTDDLYVRLFGNGDVAVMTGHAMVKAKVDEADYSGSYRGTGIFIKRDGRWQIAGIQVGPAGTPTPNARAATSVTPRAKNTK